MFRFLSMFALRWSMVAINVVLMVAVATGAFRFFGGLGDKKNGGSYDTVPVGQLEDPEKFKVSDTKQQGSKDPKEVTDLIGWVYRVKPPPQAVAAPPKSEQLNKPEGCLAGWELMSVFVGGTLPMANIRQGSADGGGAAGAAAAVAKGGNRATTRTPATTRPKSSARGRPGKSRGGPVLEYRVVRQGATTKIDDKEIEILLIEAGERNRIVYRESGYEHELLGEPRAQLVEMRDGLWTLVGKIPTPDEVEKSATLASERFAAQPNTPPPAAQPVDAAAKDAAAKTVTTEQMQELEKALKQAGENGTPEEIEKIKSAMKELEKENKP
ncbi:MAG: hypothetical protein ACKVX7_11560 [Planctomycetota bacterium]